MNPYQSPKHVGGKASCTMVLLRAWILALTGAFSGLLATNLACVVGMWVLGDTLLLTGQPVWLAIALQPTGAPMLIIALIICWFGVTFTTEVIRNPR